MAERGKCAHLPPLEMSAIKANTFNLFLHVFWVYYTSTAFHKTQLYALQTCFLYIKTTGRLSLYCLPLFLSMHVYRSVLPIQ